MGLEYPSLPLAEGRKENCPCSSFSFRPSRFLRNSRPAKDTNWLSAWQVGSRETGSHHKIQILRQDLFDLVAFAGICPRLFLISTWNPDTLGRILAWGSSYLPFI